MKKHGGYILLAGLLLMSCTPQSDTAETRDPELGAEESVNIISTDPDGLYDRITGNQAQLSIVNFWATWCVPCRAEFPDLIRVGKEFEGEGVQVLFVSTDFEDQETAVRTFLREQNVPWRSYMIEGDGYAFIQSFYEEWSGALPTTLFFDESGNLVDKWEGISTYEEVHSKINQLLTETETGT